MSDDKNPEFLPYGRHAIDDDDVAAVVEVLRSDFLTTGPKVEAFETAFAASVEAPYAVSCSSGTAGLHLAMMGLGLSEGEAAIVPSVTFVATATAARQAGAEIVFCDVDADTGLMTAAHLQAALARCGELRPRVVLPVALNGQCPDLAGVAAVARDHGLAIVEDACHALGGRYVPDGRESYPIGSCHDSDMAMFSLHPVKAVAMGEGGVVTTRDRDIAAAMRRLRNHGLVKVEAAFKNADLAFDRKGQANPWYYEMHDAGLNYRASDINCALGLSQLRKLGDNIAKRRLLAEQYDHLLQPLAPVVKPVARVPWCESGWHLYAVAIEYGALGIDRASLMRRLREDGVGTQVHYIPVHLQPYYRERYDTPPLPGADAYYERALSLPLFPAMEPKDVDRVVASLAAALERG